METAMSATAMARELIEEGMTVEYAIHHLQAAGIRFEEARKLAHEAYRLGTVAFRAGREANGSAC